MKESPVMVGEGNMALVGSAAVAATTTGPNGLEASVASSMTLQKNSDSVEMKAVIDENVSIDKAYDNKPDTGKKDFMIKMINELQKEESDDSGKNRNDSIQKALNTVELEIKAEQKSDTTVKQAPISKTPVTNTIQTITATKVTPTTPLITQPVTQTLKEFPLNDDNPSQAELDFSDAFYAEYEKYFSFDNAVTYCLTISTMTSAQMVGRLEAISNKAGYILPKKDELTLFASDLISACKDGSISSRQAAFKTRFDTAYPY
jgi:hypothetical protein